MRNKLIENNSKMTKEERSEKFGNRKGTTSKVKGKTLEEQHGSERATEIKKKIKEKRATQIISEETKKKMSGRIPWNKGKKMSDDFCKKISKVQLGKSRGPMKEETKTKIGLRNKEKMIELWKDDKYREHQSLVHKKVSA